MKHVTHHWTKQSGFSFFSWPLISGHDSFDDSFAASQMSFLIGNPAACLAELFYDVMSSGAINDLDI